MRRRRLPKSDTSAWCAGWAKRKRAHHSSTTAQEMVGTAQSAFAHPTLSRSAHLEPDRQLLRAVDKIGLRHLDLAVQGNRFQPRQQFLEKDTHFQFRQVLPEAEMRAVAEGYVAVRLAVAAELIRLLEYVLVAVAGGVAQHQP